MSTTNKKKQIYKWKYRPKNRKCIISFLYLHKYCEKCTPTDKHISVYYRQINLTINYNWLDVDFYQLECHI